MVPRLANIHWFQYPKLEPEIEKKYMVCVEYEGCYMMGFSTWDNNKGWDTVYNVTHWTFPPPFPNDTK